MAPPQFQRHAAMRGVFFGCFAFGGFSRRKATATADQLQRRRVRASAGWGGHGWVGRTRRECIHGGSWAPCMAPNGPANPPVPTPDSSLVRNGHRKATQQSSEAADQRSARPRCVAVRWAPANCLGWGCGGSRGRCAAWARRRRRAGWAGRPTQVLPCTQDCVHEQAAHEPTRTYLRRAPRTHTPPPSPTVRSRGSF